MRHFGPRIVATPHVPSQVSDLTDLTGRERLEIRDRLKTLIGIIEEHFDSATDLVKHPVFDRLGLADAGIAEATSKGVLILTSDLNLHQALEFQGMDSLNFNHVRRLSWP